VGHFWVGNVEFFFPKRVIFSQLKVVLQGAINSVFGAVNLCTIPYNSDHVDFLYLLC
jgi:hypothetical protein